ncbi:MULTISPECIES: hypothetical protein [unclassified Crossiella]|uniref:hypothetical protein n=1 Tax=unclassified Crossiella TaxID=2620835 RepID=UPI001FFF9165|nr:MULTISPECIES: hypothetical protein [unclassified Crossiella]MCK2243417.1 hypothetical protein [Crossiella sp. S99.2]MCK2257275.1 hypothetical protein [Crossiella sp. S99.1]
MNRRTGHLILAAAATAITAAALPGTASADIAPPPVCVKSTDVTGPAFDVKQCNVSDVDQFRAGLENNGNAYCGPASLYNVLHYFAKDRNAPVGWLTTDLRNVDPKNPAQYNLVTNSIGRIGVDAKYDGGTKMGNLRTAFDIATGKARNAGWATGTGNISSHTSQDFSGDLAKRLNAGSVQLVYGRYKAGPTTGSLERNGGHIVTVVAAKGDFGGNTVQLKLADPGRAGDHGDAGYLDDQSAYESLDVTLTKRSINEYVPVEDDVNTTEDESLQPGTYRTVTRWELTGPRYIGTTRQMVETFNWFAMAPPVG